MEIVDWSDYVQLGGERLSTAPGVCATPGGRVEVFAVVEPELELWSGSLADGGWSGLSLVDPEPVLAAPAAVARHPGSRDVFVRRPGYQLSHKAYDVNIGWAPYEAVGPDVFTNTGPAVCSRWTDWMDVFVRGATDHALWTIAFDGQRWLGARQLGSNQIAAAPAATSRGNGRIDVVVRGTDDALWYKSFDAHSWSGYTQVDPAAVAGAPSVCASAADGLDVFVRGADDVVRHTSFHGGWSGYEALGTEPASSAPAAVRAGGQLHVFVTGRGGVLLHTVGTPVPATSTQGDWRWCNRCQSLFFGGGQAGSRCPVGGTHAPQVQSGSGNYVLPFGVPATARRQSDWRWCDKCQGLTYGPGVDFSQCPAGGRHATATESGSADYGLPHSLPSSPQRQSEWRWCNRCQCLFFGPGVSASQCAAGGTHADPAQSGSGDYCLPHVPS